MPADRGPGLSLLDACAPVDALMVLMAASYLLYGENQVALVFCALIASGIAVKNGVPWSRMRQAMIDGVVIGLSAIFILLAVGALIGT